MLIIGVHPAVLKQYWRVYVSVNVCFSIYVVSRRSAVSRIEQKKKEVGIIL